MYLNIIKNTEDVTFSKRIIINELSRNITTFILNISKIVRKNYRYLSQTLN